MLEKCIQQKLTNITNMRVFSPRKCTYCSINMLSDASYIFIKGTKPEYFSLKILKLDFLHRDIS